MKIFVLKTLAAAAAVALLAVGTAALAQGRSKPGAGNLALDPENRLLLTAIVTDSVVTIGAKGGFMPSIWYREFHRYKSDGGIDTLIEYVPGGPVPKNPQTGRDFTVSELYDIKLLVCDEHRNIVRACYTKSGELPTFEGGRAARESVKAGDTLFITSTTPHKRIIVSDPNEFDLRPLSAYDELTNRLRAVKERYANDVSDPNDIIIAPENGVMYFKIVKIIDAARAAGFTNVIMTGLRG